jgi:hypothetical protein
LWTRAYKIKTLFIAVTLIFISGLSNAAEPNDVYIAGYAAGLLKSNFEVNLSSLVVKNGVITIPVDSLVGYNQARVLQLLSEIPGVTAVELINTDKQQSDTALLALTDTPSEPEYSAITSSTLLSTGFFPSGHLFQPLLADPRWAHFSAAYRNYIGKNLDGNNNGSVSFGETIPFYRVNLGQSTVQWEMGLQAAVFSDFNLDADSSDLINSDFIASVYSSMRVGKFSVFGRIYHQSSHLGDELLLRTRSSLERINLSYEGADLKLSYEFPYGIRVYGGGGGIFHKEPSTIKPWSIQYGTEFRSPWKIDFLSMRPILAVDLKNHEQNNWNADVSARAGFQFDNFQVYGRKFQLLMEYFNGHSPTGQFFREKVEYMGIGAHYYF